MTKQELINNTGYATEEELINAALIMTMQEMRKFRSESEDNESYDHYDNMYNALRKVLEDRLEK